MRNGSGTFIPVSGSWNPAVGGTTISSTDWAALLSDLASGLTTSIAVDGQTPTVASIPFAQGLTSSMPVGIGMTPVNVLDITQTQNNTSIVKILNASAGTGAQAYFQVSNGTALGYFYINGTGFTPSGIDLVSGTVLKGGGAGGLTLTSSSAQPVYFGVNDVVVGSFDAGGNLVPLNLLDISGTSAGQIKFPASQNASANANTLDDYEEGTFTPTLGGTASYSSRTGTYTKIGRLVSFTIEMTVNSINSGSATTISGLPFTASAINKPVSVGFFSTIATSVVSLAAFVVGGSATVQFSALAAAGVTMSAPANVFQNSAQIQLAGCYEV